MGIESFYTWINKYFHRCYRPIDRAHIDVLCVDFSDILHTCFHKGPSFLQKCKEQSLTRLHNLCIKYHPTVLYVFFDGVSPFMKMKLKRSNLYSTKYTDARDEGFIPENIDFAIKACSVFVSNVETEINTTPINYFGGSQVIISSSLTPGEGEFKIIDHINTLPNNQIKVIYSPDSDMVMLSLLSNKDNIFIINDAKSDDLLNVDELRYEIAHFFNERIRQENIGVISNIIKHFCITCLTIFKNDYVPMPFIKYDFENVMHTFRRYIRRFGLNLFNATGDILFNNVLEMMRYIDENRFDERYPIDHIYSTFDFVVVGDTRTTSTIYNRDTANLIDSERIYTLIHDISRSSLSIDEFIRNSCYDYMLLVDWMFKYYLRTPGLNMRFDYKFSFIPLIRTVYNVIHRNPRNIPNLIRDEQRILLNGNGYYTNEQYMLYTFDSLRLSDIRVKTGYDATTDSYTINPHCDLFTQMVPAQMRTAPPIRQIHSNTFILMKVQIHLEEDNYIVLSYGQNIDLNLTFYLR